MRWWAASVTVVVAAIGSAVLAGCAFSSDGAARGARLKAPGPSLIWDAEPLDHAVARFGEPIRPTDDPEVIGWYCNGTLWTAKVDDGGLLERVVRVSISSKHYAAWEHLNACASSN